MVIIHMLQIGWFTEFLMLAGHLPILLIGYLIRNTLHSKLSQRLWLGLLLLALVGCEVAYHLITGWERYTIFILCGIVVALLAGYGFNELWKRAQSPHN